MCGDIVISLEWCPDLRTVVIHLQNSQVQSFRQYTGLHYTLVHQSALYFFVCGYKMNLSCTLLILTYACYSPELALYSPTLHCTTLHYTTKHYTALTNTTLHYKTIHYTTLNFTALHYTALHFTLLHELKFNAMIYTACSIL